MPPAARLIPSTVLATALLAAAVAAMWQQRAARTDPPREQLPRTIIPSSLPARLLTAPTATPTPPPVATPTPSPAAVNINLDVPFTPQAPFANWQQPYQDACEEAAVLMVERFWQNRTVSAQQADETFLKMVKFQEERYGFYKDSNAAETSRWAEQFYPHLTAQTRYGVTADDITAALARGAPVIVLVNGRRLGNPFYTPPGPDKHTLVIKGVRDESFITNDPGTRRGADFVYPQEKVLEAMIDYDGDTPGTRTKAMIILIPRDSETHSPPRAS